MLKHHLIIAFRFLLKHKTTFIFNLLGLTVGLASSFIIMSYVLKETSYDKFHEKKDRIYRVLCENKTSKQITSKSPMILYDVLSHNFPEIESVTQFDKQNRVKIKTGENFEPETEFYLGTSEYFNIFSTKPIYGSIKGVLDTPNSIVLTRSRSELLFPGQNPVGKIIEVEIESKIYNTAYLLRSS